jgi:hypothetical protein
VSADSDSGSFYDSGSFSGQLILSVAVILLHILVSVASSGSMIQGELIS